MAKEKTIDEMIEEERARNMRVKKKTAPFVNAGKEREEIPEDIQEIEKETPIRGFVSDWKVGLRRLKGE